MIRKAFQSRSHQERSQLSSRSHLGLLEKHKDYVIRAKDYHKKQQRLRVLKSKAEFKNPDEFYFQMVNTKTVNGRHVDTKDTQFDHQTLALLKTQDEKYVQYQQSVNSAQIEKMKNSMHLLAQGKHTLFMEDDEQVEAFDAAEHFQTAPELVERHYNRPRLQDLKKFTLNSKDEKIDFSALAKEKRKQYLELTSRIKRQEKLVKVQQELQLQRNLMGKGSKRKIGKDETGKSVYKWRAERKK